jgi:hypothetical protein
VTKVFVAQHPTEAHLLAGVLESEGIPSEVRSEALFSASGEIPIGEALPEIWVLNDDQAAAARDVLRKRSTDANTAGEAWQCSGCGETVEPQFTACWKCNAEKPA